MYLSNDLKNATSSFRHGEIVELPFGRHGSYFKLFLKAKPETSEEKSVVVDCKFILDDQASGAPIIPEQWTEQCISVVPNTGQNQEVLDNYLLFWASGEAWPE